MYLPHQGTTASHSYKQGQWKNTTPEGAESQTEKDRSRTVAKKKQTATATIAE